MKLRLLIFLFCLFQIQSYCQTVIADFLANPTLGSGVPQTVSFTDQSTKPDLWRWTFGDGGTSKVKNPSHTYTATGEFDVRLYVQDTINGHDDSIIKTVRISDPQADLSVSDNFGCGPLTINFTDTSTANGAPITNWEWDFGDGETSTAQNPTHVYQNSGIYTVALKITDDFGNTNRSTRSNLIQVTGPNPNFSTTDPTTGCQPLTINFVNETTYGAPPISVEWDFGDGITSTANGNVSHTYTTVGVFNVSLKVEDLDGCSRTITKTAFVDTSDALAPVVDVAALPTITAQCEVTNITAPTATDNCKGTVTGTTTTTFPITASTTVVWSYTDGTNTITQNQSVVIDDTMAPLPDVATLPTITAQCELTSITAPIATDNCIGTVIGTATITFPITASTTVVWSYTDGDNTITQNQSVVIDDTMAPLPDVATLPTITAQCELTSIAAPIATDNCIGTVTGTTTTTFPITTSTTVVWTYTDGKNTATQNQSVIIEPVNLMITNPAPVCEFDTVDITASAITNGSTGNGILTYWNDLAATVSISNPTSIDVSGTYYIKSINGKCSDIKPVDVLIKKLPTALIEVDDAVCFNNTGAVYFEGTPNTVITYSINEANTKTITLNNYGEASISTGLLSENTTYKLIEVSYPESPFCSQDLTGSTNIKTVIASKPGLIRKHWDDVLVFDNYDNKFVSWQWYKNDVVIAGATKPYYSNANLEGSYYVKATTISGEVIQTCALDLVVSNFLRKITVIPNPIQSGALFRVDLDFDPSTLKDAIIKLFDMKGNLISTQTVNNTSLELRAPTTAGVYILALNLANGDRKTTNILIH
ncbi:PKD domain-containing protein [Mariniflexile litorale]|uniref:PKD domain-containing protein n=1 Tax=Mariniflexile litorale TaxID=3045158 RepID=A0AAU7EBT5_9FLAO|nr:PKD domain-containing protein [Mariniflexile sp. KMM 9835]MDQ8213366.1 PKD domain-containing protein [Mariniflexile sp. KMM 9835]